MYIFEILKELRFHLYQTGHAENSVRPQWERSANYPLLMKFEYIEDNKSPYFQIISSSISEVKYKSTEHIILQFGKKNMLFYLLFK